MASSFSDLISQLRRKSAEAQWALFGMALLVGGLVVGITARSRLAPLRQQESSIASAQRLVASLRSGFQPVTPAESVSWRMAQDSLRAVAAKGDRLLIAQRVARAAEDAGLADARVRFGGTDSINVVAKAAAAGGPSGDALKLADYTILIDATGGFAHVLTFVSSLPPAVSVVRLAGVHPAQGGRDARYQITLAVFETADGGGQRGG